MKTSNLIAMDDGRSKLERKSRRERVLKTIYTMLEDEGSLLFRVRVRTAKYTVGQLTTV